MKAQLNDDPGDELIVINRYYSVPDAELARGRLESEGIPAFVCDENMVGAQWLYSQVIDGMRLMVRAQDAVKAAEILGLEPIHEEELAREAGATEDVICPKCGSNNVWRGSSSGLPRIMAWAVTFIWDMIALIPSGRFRCLSCGHIWRMKSEKKPAK
jgi:predicted RNA-binding Zn-ribbon protein involved in translation (DUF1610 family)